MSQPSMRFIQGITQSGPVVGFIFDGKTYAGWAGESVASAMMRAGVVALRRTRQFAEARGYYCGMGLCWECAVHIEGTGVVRSCMHPISEGLVISFADGELAR
jgi:hypothetical protein